MRAFTRILKFSGWTLLVLLLTSLVLAGLLVGLAHEGLLQLGDAQHWRLVVDDEDLTQLVLHEDHGFWGGLGAVLGIAVAAFCLLIVLPLVLLLGVGLPMLAVFVALGAVGVALVSQHRFDMQPCAWCVLQRVVFVAIALVSLPALVLRGALPRRVLAAAGLLLAVAGMAAALWQHFVAAASASCNLTLADRIVGGLGLDNAWPEVFAAYASCADAAVKLAGLSYEFYSLVLFALLGLVALRLLRRPG